ncbi:MAG: hypothetical protein AABW89_02770 [Nanoarchaeota archaeon]
MESLNLIPVADVSEGGNDRKYTLPYRPSKYFPQDSAVRMGMQTFDIYDELARKRESIIPYISRGEIYASSNDDSYRARVA